MSLIRFPIDDLIGEGPVKEREYRAKLDKLDWEVYSDRAVLIPWIHGKELPIWVYLIAVARVTEVAAVVSFGEACSPTVLVQRHRVNMD